MMNQKRYGLGSLVISLLVFSGCGELTSHSDLDAEKPSYEVTVDRNQKAQIWDGWGTGLSWWASKIGNSNYEDLYADLLFTDSSREFLGRNLPGLDLNLVRYNIGGGGQPGDTTAPHARENIASNLDWYKDIDGFQINWFNADPNSDSWDWSRDAEQRRMLKLAQERGVNGFEFNAHAPMWWMQDSRSAQGGAITDWNHLNHARHLSEVVKRARDNWGIPVSSIEPFNEPRAGWWNYPVRQEGSNINASKQVDILKKMRAELDRLDLDGVDIAASDENTYDQAIATYNDFKKAAVNQLVDKVNVHSYAGLKPYRNNEKRRELRSIVEANKKIWMTEYGDSEATGTSLAQTIMEDIQHTAVSAWFYWQPIEPYSAWGMVNARYRYNTVPKERLGEPLALHPKYYVMAQFSRFIKAGDQILTTADHNTVAAYNEKEKRLVFVTLNWGTSQTIRYKIPQLRGVSKTAQTVFSRTRGTSENDFFQNKSLSVKNGTVEIDAEPFTIYSTTVKL